MLNQKEIYYKALLEKDESYVGVFYAGVKTTSVFCIATCRARKPKFENVEFFSSFKSALDGVIDLAKYVDSLKTLHQAK